MLTGIFRKVNEAMEKIDVEDNADQSMLTKLVRKCGKDSMIPAVMAVDSLAAGIDTTGTRLQVKAELP